MIGPEHETTRKTRRRSVDVTLARSRSNGTSAPKNERAGRASALCVAPKNTKCMKSSLRRQEAVSGTVKAPNIQLPRRPAETWDRKKTLDTFDSYDSGSDSIRSSKETVLAPQT